MFQCWMLPRTTERVSFTFPGESQSPKCRFFDGLLSHLSFPCLRRRNLLRSVALLEGVRLCQITPDDAELKFEIGELLLIG
jgi:hypothetical protein